MENTKSTTTNIIHMNNMSSQPHHPTPTPTTLTRNNKHQRATLVEEEDFNELTAVPTTTTPTTTAIKTTIVIASNGRVSKIRQLPPLKLTADTTSKRRDHNNIRGSGDIDTDVAEDVDNDTDHVPAANYVHVTSLGENVEPESATITTTAVEEETPTSNETHENATATIATSTTTPINTPSTERYTTIPTIGFVHQTPYSTQPTTTTTYTHNSKTTRSWPVIYRNPQHYDYEALYVQATSTQAPQTSNQHQQFQQQTQKHQQQHHHQQQEQPSVSFNQNCYSNQFAQSILYSSSNEDINAIDGCVELAAATPAATSPTTPTTTRAGSLPTATTSTYQRNSIGGAGGVGGSSSSSGIGGSNCFYGGYTNANGYTNPNNNQQTTCYYFAPSRHNSIYEHPSAVVGSSLHFDPSVATTAAAAAAVESLRRSNSVLLRNSSCTKVTALGTSAGGSAAAIDPATSIESNMDSGSGQVGGSTCCSNCCVGPPPILFLFFTLLMTTSATAMLCAAIMTDHWEHVTWDRTSLERYSNRSGLRLEWMLQDKVAILKTDKKDHRFPRESVFLVPMHGGIWTLCIDLPLPELQELRRNPKFPRSAPPCVNYLAGSMENARGEEQRNDWQHSESQTTLQPHLRMQNLSISCSLVCLIILGSAALVGAFGVCQRQISAILITGVMYLLAALFALFTLMIIHFKRQQGRPMLDSDYDGTVDGIVARPGGVAIMAKPLLGARIFLTSWSLDLGWGGVVLCAITSVLWILLSKIMRYNPFSALMI